MAGKKRVKQVEVCPRTVNVNDLDARLLFELITLGRLSKTFGMSRATIVAQLRLLFLSHVDNMGLSKKSDSALHYWFWNWFRTEKGIEHSSARYNELSKSMANPSALNYQLAHSEKKLAGLLPKRPKTARSRGGLLHAN